MNRKRIQTFPKKISKSVIPFISGFWTYKRINIIFKENIEYLIYVYLNFDIWFMIYYMYLHNIYNKTEETYLFFIKI